MPYASLTDVQNLGAPAQAIASLSTAQQTACLQSASDMADGYFRNRWGYGSVPLLAWDTAVTLHVARIALYLMISVRGFRPDVASDKVLQQWYMDALKWLDQVQRQQHTPLVTLANANAAGSVQPNLISTSVINQTGATGPNRGW